MGLFNRMFGKGDARNEPPSREAFAQLFLEELARQGDTRAYRVDPDGFRVLAMHEARVLALEGLFAEYNAAEPTARADLLARHVTAVSTRVEAPFTFDDAASRIVPLWGSRATLDQVSLQAQLDGYGTARVPTRRIGSHGAVALGVEMPASVRQIDAATLEGWSVSFEHAFEIALRNVCTRTSLPWQALRPGLYVAPWHDGYDASRLLLLEGVRALSLRGDPVALVPHRDAVIVTGSRDDTNLWEMASMAKGARGHAGRVSEVPWILRGDTWETWAPEEEDPSLEVFRRMRLEELSAGYEIQKPMLTSLLGADVIVASFLLSDHSATGVLESTAVWTGATRTLLPVVDRIVFGVPPDLVGTAPWARVEELFHERLTRTDHWPPRYETFGFPTVDELNALGVATTP